MASRSVQWILPLVLGLGLLLAKNLGEDRLASFQRATPNVSLESARFYARSIHKFSLGFDNLLADLAWVQLLQGASHEPLDRPGVSWEYAMVHAINTLDPKFTKAYWFGASYVSIFRRDKVGALDILEKWTQVQPLEWNSHYILGFHLFHEMGNSEKAAEELIKAAALPRAPSYLSSLGVRLLSESGARFSALQSAVALYDSVSDEQGRTRLRARIRSLHYSLQKAAWTDSIRKYREKYRREPAALSELDSVAKTGIDYSEILQHGTIPEDLHALLQEKFQFRYDPSTRTVQGILSPQDQEIEQTGIYRSEKG
jgi:tetratricopeptide (TPR) repeat protein